MNKISGGNSGGVTPVPIPNTEVKSSSAYGTAGATLWESRSLPELYFSNYMQSGSNHWVLMLDA